MLALLLVPPGRFLLRYASWSMSIVCLAAGVVLQALQWCRGPPGKLLVSGGSGLDRQNPSLSFPLL